MVMTATAIRATGLRKSYGDKLVLDGIDFDRRRGLGLRAARPERRRQDDDRPHAHHDAHARCRRGRGRRTRPADRSGERARPDRRDRPVLGGRQPADRQGEPPADGRSQPPAARRGPATDRRPDRPIRPRRGGLTNGRRHTPAAEAAARPGDDAGRESRGSCSSTSRPPDSIPRGRRTMWDIVRGLVADGITIFLTTQYLEEADELAGSHRAARRRAHRRRGHAGAAEAARPGRPHPARVRRCSTQLELAAARLGTARRDPDALALDVPTDGEVASLRAVLDQLAATSVEVAGVSLHTPDLDDVFLSLTGKATDPHERWPPNDRSLVRAPGHGDDASPEPAPRAPISLAHAARRGDPGDLLPDLRVRLRLHAR